MVATACLNDPVAPAAYRLEIRPDTIRFVALRDTLRPLVLERHGTVGPSPLFSANYEILDTAIAVANAAGLITSRRPGATQLVVRSPFGASDTAVLLVTQTVAQLHATRDTVTIAALDAQEPIGVVALDRLGSEIHGITFQYDVGDTSVATVTGPGAVRARANGVTAVRASRDSQSTTVVVRVAQRIAGIATAADTIRFNALDQTIDLPAQPVDSLGYPISGFTGSLDVVDTTVLVVDGHQLRSKQAGTTHVQFEAGGLRSDQVAVVEQVPVRIAAGFTDSQAIQSVPRDSLIAFSCQLLDANGFAVPGTPAVAASSAGHWTGSRCDNLRASTSGFDTLRVSFDSLSASIPVALAVRPIVGAVTPLAIDQFPPNAYAWAPSARTNAQGQIELYFAAYSTDPNRIQTADLYRLVSSDGLSFLSDGVVLTHDPDPCDLEGTGIENIAIVPRADGPGWRMFYSGGSFACYGWQVFSATSTDERTWTREPGARIGNGGSVPPDSLGQVPWPAGEGMVVDQLPNGRWRMTVGSYEPLTPPENKFQITEWQSTDQLSWSYQRTLVSTRQLPAQGQRSAYSPTLTEIVPGLWRMIFTADDRDQPNGRSRLWSAVSTNRLDWQVEGEILGAPGVEYFYSTLVGDRLFTVQTPQGPLQYSTTLVSVTVQMP